MPYELFKRTDTRLGNYQARLKLPDGTTRRISCLTSDRSAAEKYAMDQYYQIKSRIDNGLSLETRRVADIATMFVEEKPDYKYLVKNYIIPKWGEKNIDKVKRGEWITWRDGLKLGSNRKRQLDVIIRALFNIAIDREWMNSAQMPRIKSRPVRVNARDAFSDVELQRLEPALRQFCKPVLPSIGMGEHHFERRDFPAPKRKNSRDIRFLLYYYVHLVLATGLRPGGEVEGLRWSDLDLSQEQMPIHVKASTSKVRKSRTVLADGKLVSFPHMFNMKLQDLMAKLKAEQIKWGILEYGDDEQYIFRYRSRDKGGNIIGKRPRDISRKFSWLLKEIGMDRGADGEERTLYSLRHNYFTRKLLNGAAIHLLAKQGGTSSQMLESYYSKVIAQVGAKSFVE